MSFYHKTETASLNAKRIGKPLGTADEALFVYVQSIGIQS